MVRVPPSTDLELIDRLWPGARNPDHGYQHWRWTRICARSTDMLAMYDSNTNIIGIWCSQVDVPARIGSRFYYQLDYLEVSPYHQRTGLGPMALALVACRASELGCDGMVLGSIESARGFYEKMRASAGGPGTWQPSEPGLIPFHFPKGRLNFLKELADAVED